MTTNQQLRQLMDELSLSRQDVADILHYSIHAVNAWLRPADNKAYRRCPYIVIQLLQHSGNYPTSVKKAQNLG